MDKSIANSYYNREDIQKAILKFSEYREIAVRFTDYFGKRPDIMEYLSDIKSFVKKDVTSFHMSEERWLNPLLLADKKLSDKEKQNNRIGWDLILDLDGVDFEFAKITGDIIIRYLHSLNINNVSTKFSGNKGFHIAIPFEAFSSNIIGIGDTRKLFPQIPRKIALFLMNELKHEISTSILKKSGSIKEIAKKYNLAYSDLKIDDEESNNLNYIKLIEIDTILITQRHLFRMPYSLNEKSGLSSIPVENDKILNFTRDMANPNKINPEDYKNFEFLKYNPKYGKDANILLIKAFEEVTDEDLDLISKKIDNQKKGEEKGIIFTGPTQTEVFEINTDVKIKDFPKTIDFLLNHKLEDGKKRAMFVLLTFLYSIKFNSEKINQMMMQWNNNQPNPLRENIMHGQLNWFKNLNKVISPPNFSNKEYYSSIGVPEKVLIHDINKFKPIKIKNPLHYIFILLKQKELKKSLNNEEKKIKNNKNKKK